MALNSSSAAATPGRSRPQSWSPWSMPLGLAIAAVGAVWLGYVIWALEGRSFGWGLDYLAYHYAALRLAATGSPYQPELVLQPFFPGTPGMYLYSPFLAALLVPVASLGTGAAFVVWLSLQVAALVLACALMPVSRTIRLVSFGVACLSWPLLTDLKLGNVNTFILLVGVVAWRWMDRPVASIAVAFSLFIRPPMALIVAWWALRQQWRALLWVAAAALAIFVASLAIVPVSAWLDYAAVARNMSGVGEALRNTHWATSMLALGAPEWAAQLLLPIAYVIVAVSVLVSLRRDVELSFIVTISATLLLSPLLWSYYLVMLLLPSAFLASRGRMWALAVPLLGWLPEPLLPFVAIAGVLLPFLAKPLPASSAEASATAEIGPRFDSSVQTA